MVSMSPRLSMVVPAHNEEKSIQKTVSGILGKIRGSEVIVVCDGCTDRTFDKANAIKGSVKVVRFGSQRGKGAAIAEGFKAARGRYVGFVDADGAFSPESVSKILGQLKRHDCAIASKWKGRKFSEVRGGFSKKLFGRAWNAMIKLLIGLDFSDTQAGLKIMRMAVLEKIGTRFSSNGFEFDVELLKKIKESGFDIKEVYIPTRAVEKSSFTFDHIPGMFLSLLNLRLKK